MPVDGSAVVGRFEEGLVVEELDVGSDQVLDHIEDGVVVEQMAVVDVAFGHLHETSLQHPNIRGDASIPEAIANLEN